MNTTQSTVVPVRGVSLTEMLAGFADGFIRVFSSLRAAAVLAERVEAGQRISVADLKDVGLI